MQVNAWKTPKTYYCVSASCIWDKKKKVLPTIWIDGIVQHIEEALANHTLRCQHHEVMASEKVSVQELSAYTEKQIKKKIGKKAKWSADKYWQCIDEV